MWHCAFELFSISFILGLSWSQSFPEVNRFSTQLESKNESRIICRQYGNPYHPRSWVFHPETNHCYRNYHRGPCGVNMKLYPTLENGFFIGECDCDQLVSRMLVYKKQHNRCYPIFTKGPCKPGKWVTVSKKGVPRCSLNPCYNHTLNISDEMERDFVYFGGTCVKVNTPGRHSDWERTGNGTELCGDGFVVGFRRRRRLPLCIDKGLLIGPRPAEVRCSPGSSRAFSGLCQCDFEFD